jgi:pimeloyl-ACP methyl ester carboxylesterase
MTAHVTGKYALVNGLSMYYEVLGEGKPLVLVHGGFGVIGMFEQLLPQMVKTRQVIALELQAHGHTADIDRPLSYEFMADDVAALINHLGLGRADVLGYSLGGGVALQTAIRHPEVVRKAVVVSAPCKSGGWHAEVLSELRSITADVATNWIGSRLHQAYIHVAPKPEDWTRLVIKMGQLLEQEYDWTKETSSIATPTMIVAGDADSVRTSHAVEFFELLGGGKNDAGWDGSGLTNDRLAILPATTHYNILYSPVLASMVTSFLDAPMAEAKTLPSALQN